MNSSAALTSTAALALCAIASAQPQQRAVEVRVAEPSHDTPDGAPHAILRRVDAPRGVVVFLHGWRGCARVLSQAGDVACANGMEAQRGWALNAAHAGASSQTRFVVAQLSWLRRSGDAGHFERDGFAARWLREIGVPDDLPITIVAHSAGFETAMAWLRHGELGDRIRHVVLFDALYAGAEFFASWVSEDPSRRLISYFTGATQTRRQNRRLRGLLTRAGTPLSTTLEGRRASVIYTPIRHADVPRRHLTEVLRHLWN